MVETLNNFYFTSWNLPENKPDKSVWHSDDWQAPGEIWKK
jgi:hypothetical protein